jgi:hypothetical protein
MVSLAHNRWGGYERCQLYIACRVFVILHEIGQVLWFDRGDLRHINCDEPIVHQNAFDRFGGRLELLFDRGVVV